MGGVDRLDQIRGTYSLEKVVRTKFWYKKLFLGLMGTALANAFILWKHANIEAGYKAFLPHSQFQQELFRSLLKPAGARVTPAKSAGLHVRLSLEPPHYLKLRGGAPGKVRPARARCAWCRQNGGVENRSSLACDRCDVFLCGPHTGRQCHKLWHTVATLPKGNASPDSSPEYDAVTGHRRSGRVGRPRKLSARHDDATSLGADSE